MEEYQQKIIIDELHVVSHEEQLTGQMYYLCLSDNEYEDLRTKFRHHNLDITRSSIFKKTILISNFKDQKNQKVFLCIHQLHENIIIELSPHLVGNITCI